MLVLSRKEGESIQVGSDITITVIRLAGNRVQIGIEAPKDRRILRDDVSGVEGRTAPPSTTPVRRV